VPTVRNQHPVTGPQKLANQLACHSVTHPAVWRHLDYQLWRAPASLAAVGVFAGLGADRHAAAQVAERVQGAVTYQEDVTTGAAVATGRVSAPETDRTHPASAATGKQLSAVEEEAVELLRRLRRTHRGAARWAAACAAQQHR